MPSTLRSALAIEARAAKPTAKIDEIHGRGPIHREAGAANGVANEGKASKERTSGETCPEELRAGLARSVNAACVSWSGSEITNQAGMLAMLAVVGWFAAAARDAHRKACR